MEKTPEPQEMTPKERMQALRKFRDLHPTDRVESMMSIWAEMEDRLAQVHASTMPPGGKEKETIRSICYVLKDVARQFAPARAQEERRRIMDAIGAEVEAQAQKITEHMTRLKTKMEPPQQERNTEDSGRAVSLITLAVTDLRRRVESLEAEAATAAAAAARKRRT